MTQPKITNTGPNTYSWKGARELSTGAFGPEFAAGNCYRCGGIGHWADSPECPWLKKAATFNEHIARIDSLRDRYIDLVITEWQKREYIKHENKLWHDGKVPSQLSR